MQSRQHPEDTCAIEAMGTVHKDGFEAEGRTKLLVQHGLVTLENFHPPTEIVDCLWVRDLSTATASNLLRPKASSVLLNKWTKHTVPC